MIHGERERRRGQESAERDKYLHPFEKRESERERNAENGDKQDGSETEGTETSQAGNKKHIDGRCQSAEVNERWRRGEKQEEAGFNQTLSRSVCSEWASPPGCPFTERMHAAGGLAALHAGRAPSTLKTVTETKVCSSIVM